MGLFSKLKRNKEIDEVAQSLKNVNKKSKYRKGLSKSSNSFTRSLKLLVRNSKVIDEDYLEKLEEILIMADVGSSKTTEIINYLRQEFKLAKKYDSDKTFELIISLLFEKYYDKKESNKLIFKKGQLNVFLIIGVNGVGKTTTIGKLTNLLKKQGLKVTLAAADTFRAGAVEQLKIWSKKNEVEIALPQREKQDPSSVVYQGIKLAEDNGSDILIIDTAGRLQNKVNLIMELQKIRNTINKFNENYLKETLLILDANTGQNGISQAREFGDKFDLTGIILTKMDSSSKGGIIISIRDEFKIPIKFIGLGEGIDDLEMFDLNRYLTELIKI